MLTQRKTIVKVIAFSLVFVLVALFLYNYLSITNEEIPLMDFWLGFDGFADKVFSDQLTLADTFTIPHPIHWSALGTPISVFFMKVFWCNNLAYIYAGMIFMLLSVALILYWNYKQFKSSHLVLGILSGIICSLCLMNLNQWEIMDLYCSAPFMIRIFCYILMFFLTDMYLRKHDLSDRKAILISIGCGLLSGIILIAVSAAYYPGYVAAIFAVIILSLFLTKQKRNQKLAKIPYLLLLLGSALFVFMTTVSNSGISDGTSAGAEYIKGFFVMLGSSVIPQSMLSDNYTLYIIIGVIIFLFVIESVVMFFRDKLYEKSWIPLECLIYAGASVFIIIYGRAGSYGFETLTSSRYVVETTIGLLGIVMIQAMSIHKRITDGTAKRQLPICIVGIMISLCIMGLVVHADMKEYKTGPYRKAYYQNMINLALDVDQATDEQLTIFQAPASEVRKGIRAMKQYKLCLWNENSRYYLEEGITKLNQVWDDGWAGPEASFRVCLQSGKKLVLKGWYPNYSESDEKITIQAGDEIITEYYLDSQNIDLTFDLPSGFSGTVVIHSSFSFSAPPDERTLSFVLSEFDFADEELVPVIELQPEELQDAA